MAYLHTRTRKVGRHQVREIHKQYMCVRACTHTQTHVIFFIDRHVAAGWTLWEEDSETELNIQEVRQEVPL